MLSCILAMLGELSIKWCVRTSRADTMQGHPQGQSIIGHWTSRTVPCVRTCIQVNKYVGGSATPIHMNFWGIVFDSSSTSGLDHTPSALCFARPHVFLSCFWCLFSPLSIVTRTGDLWFQKYSWYFCIGAWKFEYIHIYNKLLRYPVDLDVEASADTECSRVSPNIIVCIWKSSYSEILSSTVTLLSERTVVPNQICVVRRSGEVVTVAHNSVPRGDWRLERLAWITGSQCDEVVYFVTVRRVSGVSRGRKGVYFGPYSFAIRGRVSET